MTVDKLTKKPVSPTSQIDDLQSILDAMPNPVFIIDRKGRIKLLNEPASQQQKLLNAYTHRERMGNLLGCINALSSPNGCGGARNCKDCPIRKSVFEAFEGKHTFRAKKTFQVLTSGEYRPVRIWITASPIRYNECDLVALTFEDIEELIEAAGLVEVCSSSGQNTEDPNDLQGIGLYVQEDFKHQVKHAY
ncbi:MAG: hypothetical protein HN350_05665 [Phycisphaerales bacterium]|jgi:hypothetical protein|nr:hypothetical protein [Phycisphaerales bacterium]